MAQGILFAMTTSTYPAFAEYIEAFQPWFELVGTSVFVKDIEHKLLKERVETFGYY